LQHENLKKPRQETIYVPHNETAVNIFSKTVAIWQYDRRLLGYCNHMKG